MMYMYLDSFDHFILGDRDDRFVSFGYPCDYALVVILGHIPLSFVEASPLPRKAFSLRLDIFTD